MSAVLSDLVPLRDTSRWPGYDQIQIIPRVYGRARISPLRYNEAGTLFVLADHALAGVDAVTLDGISLPGWRWRNGTDLTGHGVAFLQLAAPPPSGAVLAAEVRGLDGNPAAIINDLYPRSDLQYFEVWCRNAGLELGGALAEPMTLRAALQFVVQQAGAAWSTGMAGFAVPFPPPTTGPLVATLGPLDLADWSASCELTTLVTRLTVPFDWDYAAGKARQSVILEAAAAMLTHGERPSELALPWVREARQAAAIATAWLQWRARPLWTVRGSIGVQYRPLQPGGWISLNHPRLPVSGEYVIMDVDPGYGRGSVVLTAQAPAGMTPDVTLLQLGEAFD